GVSYCATCDGALYRGKEVAVVGGGDTALTDALVLAAYAAKVYLIHRRDTFRGSHILQQRVAKTANIEQVLNHIPRELVGEQKLQGIKLRSVITNLERVIPIAGLFVAVGISPQTEFLEGKLALSPGGAIITDQAMATNIPGVYAAGDCRETPLRQVITAAADGAVAASSAISYLNSLG
ncbi:MAG: FAD-dependent oxidoreductase, partial [Clostridiales bacterium]